MVMKAFYKELPAALQYVSLPDEVGADIWMRKNIAAVEDTETGAVGYKADEAYMRIKASRAEIEADFEGWYARASEWQPSKPTPKTTPEERIAVLETENKTLNDQLSTTMEAVDFLLFGGMEA